MVQEQVTSGEDERSRLFGQCLAAAGATILTMQTGIMGGWTSPNTARLTGPNSTIPLTLDEASWVASCLNLGRFASVVLSPLLIGLAGTKKTILFSFAPVSAGWLLMMLANSALQLCTARFLMGITYGMTYGCLPMYMGEVCVARLRGTFISVAMIGWPLGSLLGGVAETYLPMAITSGAYLAQCLLGAALFIWLPESPHHLIAIKNPQAARRSIAWYRGGNEEQLEAELRATSKLVQADAEQTLLERARLLVCGPARSSLLLVIILFTFQQMCGVFNIEFYMEMILIKARSLLVEPQEAVIYSNVVLLASTVLSINLIDRFGRRPLLTASSLGAGLAMAGLGMHFQLLGWGVDPKNWQWLPVAAIACFVLTYTTGFMSVPNTVLSEIFPAGLKATAASVTSLTSALSAFFASKSYLPMVEAFGEAYVFWAHAVFSVMAVPVALFMMPETRGKSLQEIQDALYEK